MKRIIFYPILVFYLLISAGQAAATNNDSIRISLLTCAPGEEIYSLFGHTAIRYENPSQGIDAVFNYGLFNFNAPNFIFRFSLGQTDYQLGVTDYGRFQMEYEMDGRSVWQQTLNLDKAEEAHLTQLLEENYQPQNRIYRYNFFYDNCSTRPRDKIEESIVGKVKYPIEPQDGTRTYRDIVRECCAKYPWERFGIDLCIGSEADRPITQRQMMFAPLYLMNAFASAQITNPHAATGKAEQRPLVTTTKVIIDTTPEASPVDQTPTPLQCALALFILVTAATIYGIRKEKGLWGIDLVLFTGAGLIGCILAFLALFSEHPTVSANYLLFVFHPGQLLLLPYIIYCVLKRKKCWYLSLNFAVLTLFMVLFPLIPQRFDFAVVPLALCLLVRSASNMILTYKKK